MKKKILSAAILLFGLTAMSVSAQEKATSEKQCTEQTDCAKQKAHGKKEKKNRRDKNEAKVEMREHRQMCRAQFNPFEGLDLTEQQQSQLEALRAEFRPSREEMKDDAKDGKKDFKEEMTKSRETYLAKVKEILTADQYVKFLENSFNTQAPKMNNHHIKKMDGNVKDKARHDAKNHKCCKEAQTCQETEQAQ